MEILEDIPEESWADLQEEECNKTPTELLYVFQAGLIHDDETSKETSFGEDAGYSESTTRAWLSAMLREAETSIKDSCAGELQRTPSDLNCSEGSGTPKMLLGTMLCVERRLADALRAGDSCLKERLLKDMLLEACEIQRCDDYFV